MRTRAGHAGMLAIAVAFPLATTAEDVSDDELCGRVSRAAEFVMEMRQEGRSLSDIMTGFASDNPLLREMVLEAWATDPYVTEQGKQRAIARFRDDWTLHCYLTHERTDRTEQ